MKTGGTSNLERLYLTADWLVTILTETAPRSLHTVACQLPYKLRVCVEPIYVCDWVVSRVRAHIQRSTVAVVLSACRHAPSELTLACANRTSRRLWWAIESRLGGSQCPQRWRGGHDFHSR